MRILCPVPGSPRGGPALGSDLADREEAAALARLGHAVDVLVPSDREFLGAAVPGVHERPLAATTGPFRPLAPLRNARRVRAAMAAARPDIVRFHAFFSHALTNLALARRRGDPPVVVRIHHVDPNPYRARVAHLAMAQSDAVVASSEHSRGVLVDSGLSADRVFVSHLGVEDHLGPVPRDAALAARLGLAPTDRVLLFVGTLEPRKDPVFLTRVLERLVAAGRATTKLVLFGTGPLEAAVDAAARSLGVRSNVVLAGRFDAALKARVFSLADVFVFPSHLEGFGLVVVEAMACGIPVVAFDATSVRELVRDGKTGVLTPPGDVDAFAAAIDRLLGDGDERAAMGKAGVARARDDFTWTEAARRTADIYAKVIG